MSIEALIFDVDGTLADTEEAHRQAFNAAFLEHELWWNWSRHHYATLLGVSGGKERIGAHIDSLALPEPERARLAELVPFVHRTKARIFAELVANGGVPLRPGIARLLREANAAGVKLAIASTTTPTNVESLLHATLGPAAPGWFSVIACGDLVLNKKPEPDIYLLALSSLGLPAESCIAFEDSGNGLRAARAAGLFTVVTPTVWTVEQDFSGADVTLADLGDPGGPLDPATAKKVGGPYLGLAQLDALHTAARPVRLA